MTVYIDFDNNYIVLNVKYRQLFSCSYTCRVYLEMLNTKCCDEPFRLQFSLYINAQQVPAENHGHSRARRDLQQLY